MSSTQNTNPHVAVFPSASAEYRRLRLAADFINTFLGGLHAVVKTAPFDMRQDLKWTTLIARPSKSMPYQMLSPAEQHTVLYGTMDDFVSVVKAAGTRTAHAAGRDGTDES